MKRVQLTLGRKRIAVDPKRPKLSRRGLVSLRALAPLVDAEELDLRDNGLTSVRDLPSLPELRTLNLQGNALATLRGIERAPNLTRLYVDAKDPRAAASLPRLEVLVVRGAPAICDFSPVPRRFATSASPDYGRLQGSTSSRCWAS